MRASTTTDRDPALRTGCELHDAATGPPSCALALARSVSTSVWKDQSPRGREGGSARTTRPPYKLNSRPQLPQRPVIRLVDRFERLRNATPPSPQLVHVMWISKAISFLICRFSARVGRCELPHAVAIDTALDRSPRSLPSAFAASRRVRHPPSQEIGLALAGRGSPRACGHRESRPGSC